MCLVVHQGRAFAHHLNSGVLSGTILSEDPSQTLLGGWVWGVPLPLLVPTAEHWCPRDPTVSPAWSHPRDLPFCQHSRGGYADQVLLVLLTIP